MFSNPLLGNFQARLAPPTNFVGNFATRASPLAVAPKPLFPIPGINNLTTGLIDEQRRKKQVEDFEPGVVMNTQQDYRDLAAKLAYSRGDNHPNLFSDDFTPENFLALRRAERASKLKKAHYGIPDAPQDAESLFVAQQLAMKRAYNRAKKKAQWNADYKAQEGGNLFTQKFNY